MSFGISEAGIGIGIGLDSPGLLWIIGFEFSRFVEGAGVVVGEVLFGFTAFVYAIGEVLVLWRCLGDSGWFGCGV